MFQVLDGKGRGFNAAVDKLHRLNVDASSNSGEHWASRRGDAYFLGVVAQADTLTVDATDAGPMLFLQNDSTTKSIIVSMLFVSLSAADAASKLTLLKNMTVGTISANTAATPRNLNLGFGDNADATTHVWDESGTAGIGGLTVGVKLDTRLLPTAGEYQFPLDESLILGKDDNLVLSYDSGATAIEATFSVRFHFMDNDLLI